MPKKKNLYIWRPIIKIKALQEILFMTIKNGCVLPFLLPLLKNIYYHTLNINCGRTFVSGPNQVLFTLGQVRIDLRPTRTNLLNPTSGRDASHPCLISLWLKEGCTIVYVSRSLPIPYLIGGRDKSPPTNYKKEKQFMQCQFFV